MIVDKVCPQALEGQVNVREVKQPSCVKGRVICVWWEAEWKAARNQAVKVSVQCSVRSMSL